MTKVLQLRVELARSPGRLRMSANCATVALRICNRVISSPEGCFAVDPTKRRYAAPAPFSAVDKHRRGSSIPMDFT